MNVNDWIMSLPEHQREAVAKLVTMTTLSNAYGVPLGALIQHDIEVERFTTPQQIECFCKDYYQSPGFDYDGALDDLLSMFKGDSCS